MIKHVSELLNKFISQENSWKIKLLNNWDTIVGDLKNKVSIEKIDRNLLVLNVANPAWAQELFMLSHLLKKQINDFLGDKYIKQLRFKTIRRHPKKRKKTAYNNYLQKQESINLNDICLTPTEQKELSKIVDKELQESLERFYLCCKRGRSKKCLKEKKKE